MQHEEFKQGQKFWSDDKLWQVTDIGSRVIIAIQLSGPYKIGGSDPKELDQATARAEGWFNGPPYAVLEHVFDEDGQEACTLSGR